MTSVKHGVSIYSYKSFADAWFMLLERLVTAEPIAPRGIKTRELTGVSLHVEDSLNNILECAERNLSYRFMLAEFLWIIAGRHDVWSISKYNKNISKFSDDGEMFFGAYGPMVIDQLPYMIEKLTADPSTRQAVISIWRPNPPPTKDVPCTLTYQCLYRDEKLHGIVTMRSSDIWLGLPYDFFNFSMLTNVLASALMVPVGTVTFNLGSSHLYDTDINKATQVMNLGRVDSVRSPHLMSMLDGMHFDGTLHRLGEIVSVLGRVYQEATIIKGGADHRPTVESTIAYPYLKVLIADTNKEALDVLKTLAR